MSGSTPDDAPRTAAGGAADSVREVRRKADRMLRGRRSGPSLWKHLAQVGVLGWLLALPPVVLAGLGHLAERWTHGRGLAAAGVVIGVVVGAYAVWRHVRPALEEDDSGPTPPGGGDA